MTNNQQEESKEGEEVEIELNQMHSKLMKSYDRSESHKEARIEYVDGEEASSMKEKEKGKRTNGDLESKGKKSSHEFT